MTYTILVIGAPPQNLAKKIAEAHAEALKSAQTRQKGKLKGK